MDIDEYTPLFGLTFSAPALDNEVTPSFGTLLSCLNVCLGYMQVVSASKIFKNLPNTLYYFLLRELAIKITF